MIQYIYTCISIINNVMIIICVLSFCCSITIVEIIKQFYTSDYMSLSTFCIYGSHEDFIYSMMTFETNDKRT